MDMLWEMIDYGVGPGEPLYWISIGYSFVWLLGANFFLARNFKWPGSSVKRKLGFFGMLLFFLLLAFFWSKAIVSAWIYLKYRPGSTFGVIIGFYPALLIFALASCLGQLIGLRTARSKRTFKEPSALTASLMNLAMPGWGMLGLNLNEGVVWIILIYSLLSMISFFLLLMSPVDIIFCVYFLIPHFLVSAFHPKLVTFVKANQKKSASSAINDTK